MNVIRRAATSNPGAALLLSNFNLFSNFQSIVHFYSEVTHRTFQFGMPEEQLNSPQVFGVAINLTFPRFFVFQEVGFMLPVFPAVEL